MMPMIRVSSSARFMPVRSPLRMRQRAHCIVTELSTRIDRGDDRQERDRLRWERVDDVLEAARRPGWPAEAVARVLK